MTDLRTSANRVASRPGYPRRHALFAVFAVLAALWAAQAAVWALTPRPAPIHPVPIKARSYFTSAQIERARDFRRPALALHGMLLGLQALTLLMLARRPPRFARRWARRPAAAAGATGALISLSLATVGLPIAAVLHHRARAVGLATQGWVDWGADLLRGAAVSGLLAAAGAILALAIMRRFPRRWWLAGAPAVVAVAAAWVYLSPVLVAPIFNDFRALPDGPVRSDVLDLSRRAGVAVDEVLVVDASRRTTAANAYVDGLGSTQRVVLYDNLLRRFSRDELRLVVAHELGHVRRSDLPRGLLWLALVAPVALFGVHRLTVALERESSGVPGRLTALAFALAFVSFGVTAVSNGLSRPVEARADAFALELTDSPAAFIAFERRIVLRNLGDPSPPGWAHRLLDTHPAAVERIGAALAYERAERRTPTPRPARRTQGGS